MKGQLTKVEYGFELHNKILLVLVFLNLNDTVFMGKRTGCFYLF